MLGLLIGYKEIMLQLPESFPLLSRTAKARLENVHRKECKGKRQLNHREIVSKIFHNVYVYNSNIFQFLRFTCNFKIVRNYMY